MWLLVGVGSSAASQTGIGDHVLTIFATYRYLRKGNFSDRGVIYYVNIMYHVTWTTLSGLGSILSVRGRRAAKRTLSTPIGRSKYRNVGAKPYPEGPVRLIEPFGRGGGPDLLARVLSSKLSELWSQPVTVENHPGAGSTAAPALVANSPADGHTLLVNTSAQAYSAVNSKNLPYDPLRSSIPIAGLTSQPYVLVAGHQTGITTADELIAAAKAKPGTLKFGSSGLATASHLGVEKFNLQARIKAIHAPAEAQDSIAKTIGNVVTGQTDYLLAPVSLATDALKAGGLRALGVSTKKRSYFLPDVPTIAEASVAGFDFPIWYGIWAPAGTPAEVIDQLAQDVAHALSGPDLRAWITEHGADPMHVTQAEFAIFVLRESEAAARLIRAAGIETLLREPANARGDRV